MIAVHICDRRHFNFFIFGLSLELCESNTVFIFSALGHWQYNTMQYYKVGIGTMAPKIAIFNAIYPF